MKTNVLSLRAQGAKQSSLLNSVYGIASSLTLLAMTLFFVFPLIANPSISSIQSTYSAILDLQADFVQSTYVAVLETTVNESGVFSMKRPGMLRIEYTGQHPKQYISNGKNLWIIDPESNQIESYKVSNETIPREALEFLNGFGEMEKLFTIKDWLPKKPIKGNTYLTLIPKKASSQYKQLDCQFGPNHLLKTIVIHNNSGNISTYVFNNTKVNTGLSDLLFKK